MESWTIRPSNLELGEPTGNPYFKKAYDFIKTWQLGQEEFVLHTSGSTGQPKPIRVKRKQLEASARMTGEALELPAGTRAQVCLHIDFIAGIMMLVRGMVLDWELTIIEPVGNPLLHLSENTGFDFVAMVPLQLQTCLLNPITHNRVERCGKILLGGAPVSLSLEQTIKTLHLPVYQSYGMTETVSHIALRRMNGPAHRADYEVLSGIQIGVDDRQCLFVHGAVTDFERIQTNDVVEMTSPHTFLWIGRNDSIINSGGLKIQLNRIDRKVEEVFLEKSVTLPFFSWYEEDERLGQKLVLFVEGSPIDLATIEVLESLRTKVKPHEIPKAVYFVAEFQKTPTDKIDKIATANTFYSTKA